jgi:hypothetical protein
MTEETKIIEDTAHFPRVIDFRIPLPWLLGVMAFLGWALISMYFSLGQLVKTVGELQITVNSGNTSVVAVTGELALLKFRLTNAEDTLKRLAEKRDTKGEAR